MKDTGIRGLRGRRRQLLLALGVLVLTAAGAESWVRRDYDARATLDTVDELLAAFARTGEAAVEDGGQPTSSYSVLHPYFSYDSAGGIEVFERYVAEHVADEHDELFTVVVLGGSVARHFCGSKHGAANLLRTRLREDARLAGRRVRVCALARPGYKQPQQMLMLAYFMSRGAVPDVVLNLDGYNEVVLGSQNPARGLPATWPSASHWAHVSRSSGWSDEAFQALLHVRELEQAARVGARRMRAWGLYNSALLGRWQLARLRALRGAWAGAQEAYADLLLEPADSSAPRHDPTRTSAALLESVDCWQRCSQQMADACRAQGVLYVHALQPTLHVPGSKRVTADERENGIGTRGLDPLIGKGYELMRARSAALRAAGVAFADLTYLFEDVEESLYYDRCHFRRAGNELVAERLAQAVLANLEP